MTDSADGNGECKKRPKTDYRILSFDGGGIRGGFGLRGGKRRRQQPLRQKN